MGKRGGKQQKKRPHEDDESGDHQDDKMDASTTGVIGKEDNSQLDTAIKKEPRDSQDPQDDDEDDEGDDDVDDDDDDDDDEEDEEVEEEEIEEEVDEEEEADEEEDEDEHNESSTAVSKQNNANQKNKSQQNKSLSSASNNQANQDKRPRLSDELYEINLRRKTEHVGSALYIPFPRKVTEEEVRTFVGQGPNIFLVGLQKLNAIVRYRTHEECEKQLQALRKKEFEGQTINIEPKTVKIDPANIDVKTLIVQYSNPNLNILDFAQIFKTASSISLKGSKGKKDGQEDLSFGSAIVVFTTHDEAREAFLETENLNIKGEHLRVVFADFRPNAGQPSRGGGGGGGNFQFRKDNNRAGNFNRGGNQGAGGGGRPQEGNFNRGPRRGGGGGGNRGGGQRFGNRNFNQNPGGFNQSRNFSPNKKFRSNMPQNNFH